jgi:hypothetical protein
MGDVSGEHIGFYMDFGTYFVRTDQRLFDSMGYDGQPERIRAYFVDRQAYSINGDRALWDDISNAALRYFYAIVNPIFFFGDTFDGAYAIHMTLDNMTFKFIAYRHSGLYVYFAAKSIRVYDASRLVGQLYFKSVRVYFCHSQTYAIYSYRVANIWFVQRLKRQNIVVIAFDCSDFANESGKHEALLFLL